MCLILIRNGDKMTVAELIEVLKTMPQELPVHVMDDNGCRDPGFYEAMEVGTRYCHWERKDLVFIYSNC